MADYTYAEAAFVGLTPGYEINLTCLHTEVLNSAISPEVIEGIDWQMGGNVVFTFDVSLDGGDETILDGIVAAHTGEFECNQGDTTIDGDLTVNGTVNGVNLTPKNSIEIDAEQYQLVGDELTPGNDKVYGTSAGGAKGWYDKIVGETGGATGRLNSWTLDTDDLYYQDFVHSFGTDEITYLLREYSNNEEVRPEKFDIIDDDTVRVYVRGNTEDLQINVVTGSGPAGPQGQKGDQGDQGIQGDQGDQGIQGIQGIQGDPGVDGDDGADGADGQGVPAGGTTGQHLAKIDGTDYNTEWVTPTVYMSDLSDDTTPQLGGDLDLNQKYIELDPAPTANQTGNGLMATMQVDVNTVGIGAALHLDTDGNFILADADAATTVPCSAVAIESGTGSKKVLFQGVFRDDTWSWTPGGEIYVSTTAGTFTQTAPSGTGDQVQRCGIALSADVILFNPGDYTVVEVS